MNPRALFSGPSRIRLPSLSSLPSSSSSPTLIPRRFLTFPHPDLDPSKGHTRLVIKSFDSIPSLLHAYAIIRAVSAKLNASILEVKIPKDPDSLKHATTIFLTTLRPVQLYKPLLLEIPPPSISGESNFLGGPSLGDIEGVLSSTPQPTAELTERPSGKNQPIQFRVEPQRNPVRTSQRPPKRTRYRGLGHEGIEIVKELQKFGDGFYGGFKGLADRFEQKMREEQAKPKRGTRTRPYVPEQSGESGLVEQSPFDPITIGAETASRDVGEPTGSSSDAPSSSAPSS